jgi:hypothetical protein
MTALLEKDEATLDDDRKQQAKISYDGSGCLAEQMNALKTAVAGYGFDRIETDVLPSIPDGDAYKAVKDFLRNFRRDSQDRSRLKH